MTARQRIELAPVVEGETTHLLDGPVGDEDSVTIQREPMRVPADLDAFHVATADVHESEGAVLFQRDEDATVREAE